MNTGSHATETRARSWLQERRWVEALFVVVGGYALAVAMNWPLATKMSSVVPQDLGDPVYFAWILAWPAHALLTNPTKLWDGNVFYPEQDSYAFTDSLLGYLPFSFFGDGVSDAIVRYNVVFLTIFALAFIGGYLLTRQLGAAWPAAIFAGIVMAYAPWRLGHAGHLNILSTGGITLAFFALARGHGYSFTHGYRPEKVRPAWVAVGWVVACWQISIGFAIGLSFGYAVAIVAVAAAIGWWRAGRPALASILLKINVVGGLAFVLVSYLMARPYLRIAENDPNAARTVEELERFAPPARGLLIAPGESWLWGNAHQGARAELSWPPEMALLPGMAVLTLAIIGMFYGIWRASIRIWLAVGAAITAILALGTSFFGGHATYLVVRELPGWDSVRTSGRVILWTTFLLALLAAGALTRLGSQLAAKLSEQSDTSTVAGRGWRAPLAAALLVPALIAAAEGYAVRAYPKVPPIPPTVSEEFAHGNGPFVVLPGGWNEFAVALWSTHKFPKVTNGSASYWPQSALERPARLASFPDETSVDYLRDQGVRTAIVLRNGGDPAMLARPVSNLGVERIEHPDAVVFHLD